MSDLNEQQLGLLAESRIASVATIDAGGFPHLTAVWFLYEDDCLYLAIPSSSAKGRNLLQNPRIAIMVDARVNYAECGLTAIGTAEIIKGDPAVPIVERLHKKYLSEPALADPAVGPVFAAMDDWAVKLKPGRWISWDMATLDAQVFGGGISKNDYMKPIVP